MTADERYALYKAGEKGWAPCFHGEDANEKQAAYVAGVTGRDGRNDIETLLWDVGTGWYSGELADGVDHLEWAFYADQWVGVGLRAVSVSGEIVAALWTEGDNFLLAIARTIERLREKGIIVERSESDDDD